MKKISTLFKKDPSDLSRVIDEIDPSNEWALTEGEATVKYDGTACAIINGELYARYDVKKGREVPEGAIPCQEPDEITGHWPNWVKCTSDNPQFKYHLEAFKSFYPDGTYELIGPKIQGNPHGLEQHILAMHGSNSLHLPNKRSFYNIKEYLRENKIEGIVFHHPDGRMCKIRRKDFGFSWPVK